MATHRWGQLSITFLAFSLLLLGLPADPAQGAPPAAAPTQTNPITYVYDELGRLRAVVDPAAGAAVYRYDSVGNILSITRQSATATSIIEFDPKSGQVSTTSITIYGTGFSATPSQNTVKFNGVTGTVSSSTPTTIVATVPATATTGPISVTSPNGSATSSQSFTVVASKAPTITGLSPTIGAAGDSVSITGTNFDLATLNDVVAFSGARAQVTAATATSLTSLVPPQGGSGHVTVVTPNGKAVSSADFFLAPSPYRATDVDFTDRMQIGGAKTATITTAGHIALVIFDGSEGQRVSTSISMNIGSGCCTALVSILAPDGRYLASPTWTGPTGGFVDTVTLPADGTYTIVLDPDQSLTGSATFTLNDIHDLTGTLTPTTGGSSVTSTISTPGQNASYTFTGSVGQRISLNVTNITFPGGCCSGAKLSILNPDGSTYLVSPYEFGNFGTFVDLKTLTVAGTYTIGLDPQGPNTGSATLTLYQVPTDLTGTLTVGGQPLTINIATPAQNARLTFAGSAGQKINVTVSNVTFPGGCCSGAKLSILNPDGSTYLVSPYDFGNFGSSITTPALSATGTYTIVVDPQGPNTGSATLALTLAPAGAPVTTQNVAVASRSLEKQTASVAGRGSGSALSRKTARTLQRNGEPPPWVSNFRPPGPEEWVPGPGNFNGYWQTGRPDSPLSELGSLVGSSDSTALSGQALTLKGEPLAGVTLSIGEASIATDESGRFLLEDLPAGHQVLQIDGTTANQPAHTYGTFEVGIDLDNGELNVLPFTIWMPLIDTPHAESFPSPTTSDVTLSTPRIPGLQVIIPAGSVVKDEDGNVVTKLSITAVPTDRTPFPLPSFFETPVYFTVQPGGSYIFPDGARIIYPNYTNQPPGARAEFWDYDADGKGWYIYGYGSVSANGTQIVPDAGVKVYAFSGAMINDGNTPPATGPKCSFWATLFFGCYAGDPVDPQSGLLANQTTDLYLPGTLPISLTRVYRQADTNSRVFGLATNFTYGMFLWSAHQYTEADLIMPDGARVHYVRTSPGTGFPDAIFESTSTPGPYYKSTIVWNGAGWDLKLKDGTVFVFGENAPLQSIRDRYGNQITITRTNGRTGNITQVSSSDGRWIKLTYDTSNRIVQAQDNIGRAVGYHYDASGRLDQVTDADSGITRYGWGSCAIPGTATCNQMNTITDPRGNVVLTNAYDGNGRIQTQTLGDGTSKYTFAYTLTGGVVTQTDITDPRGFIRRLGFNADGYTSSEILAVGKTEQQSFTYGRQAGTGLLNSVTDPLGRQTLFAYDPKGNVTSLTRLAGTPQAVTTTFTYDPRFNELATVTNPLSHTTTYTYDAKGNLSTVKDALNRTSTFTYNTAGQLKTAADPIGNTWTYTYTLGDLTAVSDPLGRTTTRFVDSGGRVIVVTDPLGHQTRRDYDSLNELTKITDPLGGQTTFVYDPAGNLMSVTDAKLNTTLYGYDAMDRLTSRKNALLKTETYGYDGTGNVISLTDRKSQVSNFTYDGLGRRTFAGFAKTGNKYASSITYTYDAGNRITKLVDTRGGTITRTFDGLDQLKTEITPNAPANGVQYAYDNAGRRTSMTVGSLTPVTYAYNNANQLTSVSQGAGTQVGFTYDGAGRPASITLPDAVVQTYGYDLANELTSISYTKGATTLGDLSYGYDQAGRRNGVWGSYARTALPAATSSNAAYNANNQLTSWNGTNLSYDLDGNLTAFGTQTYTWNERNQLTATSVGSSSFAYDGLGRRLSKTVGGTTSKFLYDGPNIVQEQSSTNAATANLLTGLGLDQTFSRAVVGGATSSLLTDALGSTVALADSTGIVQTSYTYDPFGGVTSTGSTNTNSYQFTGRENDGTPGLYFNRARYYSPTFGRFISEDPLGFPGGSDPDLYRYARSSPTFFTDPLGLDPEGGCGFLGLGCVANLIDRALGFVVWRPLGWLTGVLTDLAGASSFSCGDATCYENTPWLFWARGFTFSHSIFCSDTCYPDLIRHEQVHVEQFDRVGLSFVPRYLYQLAVNGSRCDNPWEREAYVRSQTGCGPS
jgi:RHS repeat-associated protein